MPGITEVPAPEVEQKTDSEEALASGYHVIVWNDPVNQMQYVTHVFQSVFGWEWDRAQKHMLEVHETGKSVVAHEGFEKAEFYVHELQKYSLTATMEPAA